MRFSVGSQAVVFLNTSASDAISKLRIDFPHYPGRSSRRTPRKAFIMAGAAVRFTRIGGFLAGRVMLRHRPCRFLSNGSGSRTERTNYDHERKLKAKSEATRDSRAETSVLQSLMETDTTQSGELTTAQKGKVFSEIISKFN